MSTFAAPGRSLLPPAFCSRTPSPEGVEPCSPVQAVHVHVHTRARPRKRAATPPQTPQSRRRRARAAPSRLPRATVLVRELHLMAARSCMRSTKLSPLLSLLESGEHVHTCQPNLTVAQPVAAGTPSSRASLPSRCTSAGPNRALVRSRARERIQPHRRWPPQPRHWNLFLCSAAPDRISSPSGRVPNKMSPYPCPNRALGSDRLRCGTC
jgi:hypothetical protein